MLMLFGAKLPVLLVFDGYGATWEGCGAELRNNS
ncbi:MAG: hypothetical protein ACI9Y1_000658 [Lentisphaeria bacterium]|jgi:hypothetical protein